MQLDDTSNYCDVGSCCGARATQETDDGTSEQFGILVTDTTVSYYPSEHEVGHVLETSAGTFHIFIKTELSEEDINEYNKRYADEEEDNW